MLANWTRLLTVLPCVSAAFRCYCFCCLQGFPMKQGVLTNGRVQLLMSPGDQVRRR